ncbi:MAG TPA: amidohydrolase family protein, partial [Acidimicrobiales bacterium]
TRFLVTFANDDEAALRALLTAEGCVLGLSDAGAHTTQMCDAPMPVDYLAHWVRDRSVATLETGIRRVSGELADLLDLPARGYVAPGFFADLVVLDWERLGPGPTRRVTDMPARGDRLVADRPSGIPHVVVNGTPIRRDGVVATELDELPGGLLGAVPPQGVPTRPPVHRSAAQEA